MATLKNTTINDTGFLTLPPGTTAQRPASPTVGMVRYNTDLGFSEQYTADGWQGIAPPPVVSSISPTSFNGEGGTSITVNGSTFDTTAYVAFVLTGGTVVNATTTTRNSSSQLVATTPRDFLASESPATIRVVNGSGLTSNLENALSFSDVPVFATATGSIGTIFDSRRSSYSLSAVTATDANGGSISSYAITSGALPTGLSFNTTTAAITGTASAVGSDTTSNFTVRATDNAGNTTDRAFSITVRAPVITSFTSTGSSTFSVPTGITSVEVLVVAGGGAGGGATGFEAGGGGGAGGMVYHTTFPVSPGGSVPLSVGAGGSSTTCQPSNNQASIPSSNGSNSNFGSLTALGGGHGGGQYYQGFPGGSGGGMGGNGCAGPSGPGPGSATQPGQSNPGATTNAGNPGGSTSGGANGDAAGAAGGGAGGAGGGAYSSAATGGAGLSNSISGSSVAYAGGGGGAGSQNGGGPGSGGNGGGGRGSGSYGGTSALPGTTNRGGGGGGACAPQGTPTGAGGPGIIVVKY